MKKTVACQKENGVRNGVKNGDKTIILTNDKKTERNFFTVTETAKRLKLTRQAVLDAIKAGKLAAIRIGRQWVVSKPEIDRAYFVNVWDSRGKLLRNPAIPACGAAGGEQPENGY
jgi:excisionase family DNA binding protein